MDTAKERIERDWAEHKKKKLNKNHKKEETIHKFSEATASKPLQKSGLSDDKAEIHEEKAADGHRKVKISRRRAPSAVVKKIASESKLKSHAESKVK